MEKAAQISRVQQRMPDLAVCQLRYAELQLREGARDEAIRSLNEAEQLFATLDMRWWLDAAKRLRQRL